MFLSLNDTCSVPERWKIWAMSVMSAPCSRDASALGTQAMAKSALPWASDGLRHDVDAALEDLRRRGPVLVVALVERGEVAGELGLGEPLQLQLDRRQRAGGGRRRPGARRRGRPDGAAWSRRRRPSCPTLLVLSLPQAAATSGERRRCGDPSADGARLSRVSSPWLVLWICRWSDQVRRCACHGMATRSSSDGGQVEDQAEQAGGGDVGPARG